MSLLLSPTTEACSGRGAETGPMDPECTINCGLPGTRMRSFHVPRTEGLWKILLFPYKAFSVLGTSCYTSSLRLAVIKP